MRAEEIEILLVEDSSADAELTLHALRKNALVNRIHVVRDGEEALNFLFCKEPYEERACQPLPQLILLDLKLPKVDGLSVLRALKEDRRTRWMPVIVLTSSKEERDLTASYDLGVNSYIQKPVDFEQFRETVRYPGRLLAAGEPATPAASHDQSHGEVRMSQTMTHAPLTTLWNMAAPLHVMLIENSVADAELNLHELGRAGFQCQPQIVATRAEFLQHLGRFPFDIVLADYRLPGWTGMDAFSAMRQAGRDVPFILVTGILGEEVAVECIKQGVTDYVLKEHLARLPLVVARALEERALRDARNFMVQALRQSEANSLFLFAHNPLPMWVFENETLQFLQVNDAALRHYGYDRMEFLQMSATDLHPAEEVPKLLAAFQDRQSGGAARRPVAPPQERWFGHRRGNVPAQDGILRTRRRARRGSGHHRTKTGRGRKAKIFYAGGIQPRFHRRSRSPRQRGIRQPRGPRHARDRGCGMR